MNLASHLKQTAERSLNGQKTNEFIQICNKCKAPAKEGKFELLVDGLSQETINLLQRDGFTVETGGRYNEIHHCVKW